MDIRYQLLLGNTASFAIMIAFEADPDGGVGATDEMAASWGAFQLWIRGQNLCARLEDGETVSSVRWYLLPLLDWLVDNWEPLFHEEKLPIRNAADGACDALHRTAFPPVTMGDEDASRWDELWYSWRSRHALQACREGGLFPDVVFRRFRDRVEVSWGEARLAGSPKGFRFASSHGVERLVPSEVAKPMFGVVSGAAEFLAAGMPKSRRLASLVKRINKIRETPRDERLAWMVGLGETRTTMRKGWARLAKELSQLRHAEAALWAELRGDLVAEGSCHVALMFGSASPMLDMDDVLLLAKKAVGQYCASGPTEPVTLRSLVRDEPAPLDGRLAFESGYRLAEEFLAASKLDLEKDEQIDINALLEGLKINIDSVVLKDAQIRAVAIAGSRHRTCILVNTRSGFNTSPAGRRFTLAHELCHILHDRSSGRELSLISGPWAPLAIERRANAFAAMVLMPVPLLKRAIAELSAREDSADGVRLISRRLGTSTSATMEHLGNLQQWDDATRERVRADLQAAAALGVDRLRGAGSRDARKRRESLRQELRLAWIPNRRALTYR